MTNQTKNPIFWSIMVLLLGIGLGVWGMIKADCSGPNCWVGSGFLEWTGGILIILGILGFFTLGNKK